MPKLSLKRRMLGLIIFVIAISLIGLMYTTVKIQTIGELTQKLYRHPFTVTTNVLEAEKKIIAMHRDMKDVVLSQTPSEMERAVNQVLVKQNQVLEHFAVIEERILGEEGKALEKRAKRIFVQWEPIRNEVIALIREKEREKAAAITQQKGFDHVKVLLESMSAMTAYAYGKANQFKNDSATTLKKVTRTAITLSLLFAALALAIGIYFSKTLSEPILNAVHELSTTSAQILSAIQEQSTSIKEQAAAVQETTTTMEQVSQTGSQISDKATAIAQSAELTSTTGVSGIKAVSDTNETMDLIREQVEQVADNIVSLSEKTKVIGDIIQTVNDIAEQSNLLSLNATIEAVGAGEHGKRFSVVAGEIKNLADQAKTSTIEVRTILTEIQKQINTSVMSTEESVKRVDTGKNKSEIAFKTIDTLTRTTEESIQGFQQIIASTNQQQIGMEQVTEALKNIRKASDQTSIGVSQIERAIANLNGLGGQLKNIVEPKADNES